MHDKIISSYNVDFHKKNMCINLYNRIDKRIDTITFSEVLTHSFDCILDYNIILEIQEMDIMNFLDENKEKLKKNKDFCWPIDYQTEEELKDFLNVESYKYFKIYSSYGMSGWVIAKKYIH